MDPLAGFQQTPDLVNYTISQDFAAGKSVEQIKNLQNFLETPDNSLLWPTSNHLSRSQTVKGGNQALHDYKVYLMQLEQQNKKRLLMARQEKEHMGIVDNQTSRHAEQVEISNKRRRVDAHGKPYVKGNTYTIPEETEWPSTFSTTDVQTPTQKCYIIRQHLKMKGHTPQLPSKALSGIICQ